MPGSAEHRPLIARIPDDDSPWDILACTCLAKVGADDDGRAWFASHIEALGAPDYMVGYWRHWSHIVEPTNGGIDRDAVARELFDYRMVLDEVPKVYDELAGLSKPHTAAHHVIAAAQERFDENQADLLLHDLLPKIDGDENRQSVISYAETLHPGAWEEHQRWQATRLQQALLADGFLNPPAVGSVWVDTRGEREPGQQPLMRITSIGKTETGWQARFLCWNWPAAEPSEQDSEAIAYVHHLLEWFAPVADSVNEWKENR